VVEAQAANGGALDASPKTARQIAQEKEEADRVAKVKKATDRKAAEEAVKRYYASSAAKSVQSPAEASEAGGAGGYDMSDPTFAAFRLFDPDATGFVNEADLRDVLRSAGLKTKSVEFKSLKERLAKMRGAHPAAYAGAPSKPGVTLVSFDHLLVALREGGFVASHTTAHKSAGSDPLAPPAVVMQKGYEANEEEQNAFRMFDPDDSGVVQVRELRIILRSCGHELSIDEIESMALQACAARDSITTQEFNKLLGYIHAGEAVSVTTVIISAYLPPDSSYNFRTTSPPCHIFISYL
jgi:Ca2+-binding EF-hand superfamily protein